MAFDKIKPLIEQQLAEMRAAGLYKTERILLGPQGGSIRVAQGTVINLCANNYLGLADHPAIVAAAAEAVRTCGYGMASVRFICGTQDLHKGLERAITSFLGTGDTILYSSCFDANTGLFETLLGEQDAVLSDALNHASVIDGIRLCKAQRYRYAHGDMAELEKGLRETDGFTSGGRELIELRRQRWRPCLFSTAVPPMICAAGLKALELIRQGDELRHRLDENAQFFRQSLEKLGFKVRPGTHPIMSVMLGDAALAVRMADRLLEEGVYVIGFSYPLVPNGEARIRVHLSAAHTREQLTRAVTAFEKVGRELCIIR